MSIPVNPTASAGAQNFNVPSIATSSGLCEKAQGGFKFVAMQFTFENTASWLADMSAGSPNPPLNKVAALYVDAVQSTHDVLISFPDSGYQVRVTQGSNSLVPALSGKVLPKFYVTLLSNSDAYEQGPANDIDVVNVTAMNQFVPEFSTGTFLRQVAYGLGDFFEPTPIFTPDDCFTQAITFLNSDTYPLDVTLINHPQWYVNIIDWQVECTSTDSNPHGLIVQLLDGATVIAQKTFSVLSATQNIQLGTITGMNYQSKSGSPLVLSLASTSGATTINVDGLLCCNIFGGVLTS